MEGEFSLYVSNRREISRKYNRFFPIDSDRGKASFECPQSVQTTNTESDYLQTGQARLHRGTVPGSSRVGGCGRRSGGP